MFAIWDMLCSFLNATITHNASKPEGSKVCRIKFKQMTDPEITKHILLGNV